MVRYYGYKEDPQTFGIMGPQSKAATQSHGAAKGPRIQHRLFHVPESTRRLSGGSDKWLYVAPEYRESFPV
jgi:hypothetical protein